jgi:hypothetical protein
METHQMERLIEKGVDWLNLKQFGATWTPQHRSGHTFHEALSLAYAAWMPDHRDWNDSLFDKYFLTHRAGLLLSRFLEDATLPEPVELAQLWAEQFTWFNANTKQRHIEALVPAAAHFLHLLETRLR